MSVLNNLLHSHSPFRIFFFSVILTLFSLGFVWESLGIQAAFLTLVLIVVELTFSFDNAIINAKILRDMSPFWQRMFITVGILIAVVGMRLVFPILIVSLTSGLAWGGVIDLALNHPDEYAHELHEAHTAIASFGGMFLLMLSLHFFFDPHRDVHWIRRIEKPLQKNGSWWLYTLVSLLILTIIAVVPYNEHPADTMMAGLAGIVTYLAIHGFITLVSKDHGKKQTKAVVKKTGLAGFASFAYLEVLDASFSFDGVIGAFAITSSVILITIGLGIGALWVRSITIFMVRRQVLDAYRYLEHGAHYTIFLLALIVLGGLFYEVPEYITGTVGISIIVAATVSSIKAKKVDAPGVNPLHD